MNQQDTVRQFGTATIPRSVFIARGTYVIGNVQIGEHASIWFNCVLRGDVQPIVVGARTNIQDSCILHGTTDGLPTLVGKEVTVGHGAILHACTIEDQAFVGFGARILDGAIVRTGGMLAAGSVLTPQKEVGSGELWGGNPARFLRRMTDQERAALSVSADRYVALARQYILAGPVTMQF